MLQETKDRGDMPTVAGYQALSHPGEVSTALSRSSESAQLEGSSTLKRMVGTPETDPVRVREIQEKISQEDSKKRAAVPANEIRFRSGYRLLNRRGLGEKFKAYVKSRQTEKLPFAETEAAETPVYLHIQFTHDYSLFSENLQKELSRLGVRLVRYLKTNAYYAAAPLGVADQLGALVGYPEVVYLDSIPSEARISQELLAEIVSRPEQTFDVEISFIEEPLVAVHRYRLAQVLGIADLPGRVTSFSGPLEGSVVARLAELDFIDVIQPHVPRKFHNFEGTMLNGRDLIYATGSYTGAGVNIAIGDSGIAQQGGTFHPDLTLSRISDQFDYTSFLILWCGDEDSVADDLNGHGTHVAGIAAGGGISNSRYRGTAPGASLLAYKMSDGSSDSVLGQCTDSVLGRAANHAANIVNFSWGSGHNTYGSDDANNVDRAVRGSYTNSTGGSQPMFVTVSAGNDGYQNQKIGSPGTAKNALTVGSVRDGNYRNFVSCDPTGACAEPVWPPGQMSVGSSYGPVDTDSNGYSRIKPDVAAPGLWIVSTVPWYVFGNYYQGASGTSMAAPSAAGLAGLMMQAVPSTKSSPMLAKVAIINAAVHLASNDQAQEGRGVINGYNSLYDQSGIFTTLVWTTGTLSATGASKSFSFTVPSGFRRVRATLAWADPPGSEEAINDLDLRVYDANGTLVGASASYDDNVEDTTISTGVAGNWTATVTAYNLGQAPQSYAIVVTAVLADPSLSLSLTPSSSNITPGSTLSITSRLSNSGFAAIGAYSTLTVPAGFTLDSVDITSADGRSVNYAEAGGSIYRAGSKYYVSVGELVAGKPRSLVWNLVASGSASGSYSFPFEGSAGNASAVTQSTSVTVTLPPPPPTVTTSSASLVTSSGGTLNGTVNPNGSATTAWFEWGTSSTLSSYSSTSSQSVGSGTTGVAVSAPLGGLNASTTYYFRVAAQNSAGTTRGSILSFTTTGTAPAVTTSAASSIGTTTATLNGTVNPNGSATTAWFEWGTDSSFTIYSSTPVQSLGSGTSTLPISANLTGLTPGTTYYLRAAASNSVGTSRGAGLSFAMLPPQAPAVSTDVATSVTSNSATLNGQVNPNGSATTGWFEWGTQPSLSSFSSTSPQSVGSDSLSHPISADLTGLNSNTTYYFRAAASNSGGTTKGSILGFTPVSKKRRGQLISE